MDRRGFLTLIGGAGLTLAGGLTLDACSSGGTKSDLVVIPNDWEFLSGRDYRLSVLLASNAKNGAPIQLTSPVTLRVGPNGGSLGPPMSTVIHGKGPEPTYALTTYHFPTPGNWTIEASYQGQKASTNIVVTDPSASGVPSVGQPLVKVPTPTTADARGVNPICTAQPACPFHQVSLDAAMDQHQPIALLFATPALCQSRFCGPVLNNLVAAHQPWAGRVTFIHCEIYTDLQGQTTTQPVQGYRLEHEPMLLLAGTDGMITGRIDNLFDETEAHDALTAAFGAGTA